MKKAIICSRNDQKKDWIETVLFSEGYITRYSQFSRYLSQQETELPDLLVIFPDGNPDNELHLCQQVVADKEKPHPPILVVTDQKDNKQLADWLDTGASDFLYPDMPETELRLRIKCAQKTASLISENASLQRSLNEIKRTDSWYKKALTNSQIVIYCQDTELRYTWIFNPNPGFRPETVLGHTDRDLYSEADASILTAVKQSVLKNGVAERHEIHLTINGLKYYYDLTVDPVFEDGFITGITCVNVDITEFKSLLERLTFSEDRYFKIFNLSPSGILLLDQNGTILEVNESYCRMMGYNKNELIHQHISNISDPANHHIIKANILRLLDGEILQSEVRNRNKEGFFRTISLLESRITLTDKTIGIVSVANDITDQKRSEAVTNALFHISTAVLTTTGVEEFIATIQTELAELLDVTNFYVGFYDEKTDHITIPYYKDQQDDIDSFPAGKSLSAYVIRTGKPLLAKRSDLDRMMKEGIIQTVGAQAAVWLGVPFKIQEAVRGLFAVQSYTDENAFTQNDLELMEFVAEQVGVFLERKKYEADLILALRKAEESDRLKSAFLANMSHEIRTPLNSIMGFADLLNEEDLSVEEKTRYTSTIIRSGDRLLRIINDILDLSKIESGIIQLNVKSVDLHVILHEMKEEFLPVFLKKKLKLVVSEPPAPTATKIKTDPDRIRQILANLMQNAVRYTHTGVVTLGYELKNDMAEFFVRDTGPGITLDMQDKIFNRFIQLEKNKNNMDSGTGLGLAITKGLVELLGGQIWLASQTGTGTTFFFTLPLNPAER